MKALLLAVAVIVLVVGIFVVIVSRDPNRVPIRDALEVLHESASGVPQDPEALGYLRLRKRQADVLAGIDRFDREFSAEIALQEPQTLVVEGTLLKQEYLLRQAEYKLAQLKSIAGDMTSDELEKKRVAYAGATKNFQMFWDTRVPAD